CGPASIDAHVAADCPAQERQPLMKRREERLESRIVRGGRQEHADAPHALGLLRMRRERPCARAAEKGDELASLHSITSSARSRNDSGMARPIALAVLRLTTSWNFVGYCTGRSAGLVPRSMRSTYPAAC